MTQKQRVLAAMRRRGAHGITQTDFDAPDVIDGGPPIKRVAARVEELRGEGHGIDSTRRRHRMAVYVLKTPAQGMPPAPAAPSSPAGGVAGPLFHDSEPQCAIFDEIEAA